MVQVAHENLVIIITVGSIAGWLVGHFVKGIGFGILGDVVVGIAGAFIGGWLLPQLKVPLGRELNAAIINPALGALLFLFAIGIVRGAIGGSRGRRKHEWHWL